MERIAKSYRDALVIAAQNGPQVHIANNDLVQIRDNYRALKDAFGLVKGTIWEAEL